MPATISVLLFVVAVVAAASFCAAAPPAPQQCKKVLVVGSGITGASFAYFLKNLTTTQEGGAASGPSAHPSFCVDITVVEKEGRVGGRVHGGYLPTRTTRGEGQGPWVEYGASVYHSVNRYMSSFVETFNLSRTHPYNQAKLGLWKGNGGEGFTFREAVLPQQQPSLASRVSEMFSDFMTKLSALWRYGLSPIWATHAVDTMARRLDAIYTPQLEEGRTFPSADSLLEFVGLLPLTHQSMARYMESVGVGSTARDELVFALNRLNYGQDPEEINALAGSVAMKGRGDEVFAVEGGNVKLIEKLLDRSGATVLMDYPHLKLAAAGEEQEDEGAATRYPIEEVGGTQVKLNEWDAIVIAAPRPRRHPSGTAAASDRRGYAMHITHATFVQGALNASYFTGKPTPESEHEVHVASLPTIIIAVRGATLSTFRHMGRLKGTTDVYKIFSDEPITTEHLKGVFLFPSAPHQPPPPQILHRVRWEGYPKLVPQPPTTNGGAHHPFLLHKGDHHSPPVFDAGALEYAVSTLETQCIGSMNTALLVREHLLAQMGDVRVEEEGGGAVVQEDPVTGGKSREDEL